MRDPRFHLDTLQSIFAAIRDFAFRVWSVIRAAARPARWQWWAKTNLRMVYSAVLVGCAYYISALIGLSITFQSLPISPIWPPNAILLVALLLVPMEMWWLILLAVFGAHMLVELPSGIPLTTTVGLYFTNSAEAVLGAFLVRRLSDGSPWLGSLRRVIVYLACAVIVAPVITSFADAAVVVVTRWGENYWQSWEARCVSNSLAELTIGPALLLALTRTPKWIRRAGHQRWIEGALLLGVMLIVGIVVFGGQIAWQGPAPTLAYAILPLLLWAAIRFGVGGTSACLLGITVLATWSAAHGRGPFSVFSPVENVIALQLFLIGVAVPMLILAALTEERQYALQALQTSEARYRELVESQTEMICRYLPDSTLTFVNEAYCRFYGKSREQLIGTRFLDLMDQNAHDHHVEYTAALQAEGHPAVDEHEITLPDGSIRWQQWVDHAVRDEDGEVVEIQAVGRDITDRKQAEDALNESEARFRAAFESAATGMMLVDTTGRALQVNRPLADMLGYSEAELLTHTFMELTHPDDVAANVALFNAGLAGELDNYQLEKRLIHKDGHLVWTMVSAGVVRDTTGQPYYVIGQIQDITERRRAEEALRASEERYRAVVNNFPHGMVLLFGQDWRHIFADGQGLPDIGVSQEAIVGKTIWEAFSPELSGALAPRYQAALEGVHAVFDLAYAGHVYQTQVLPIHYADTTAGMTIMQDVTEQRRAEVLAELDQAKTAFFSNVSHEFRTPLTLLLGPAVDALADRDAPLPPRQRERLELIRRGGVRLHKLVNTLLDFSRIEAGRVQATYEPTDVAALTADLASTFRSAVERAGLRLVVESASLPGLARPVYLDREMWEKIVLNLLSNALKFTFEGAITVTVSVRRYDDGQADEWVELEVSDTGTGIPAEDLPHLFERFYRVQGAEARTHEGTGIGLALVQELVRLHGGRVRVASTPGTGSTFTVAIPTGDAHLPTDGTIRRAGSRNTQLQALPTLDATLFADEALRWLPEPEAEPEIETKRVQPPADPTPVSTGGSASILVVDDNADMRTYLMRLLSERWEVQTVADGSAAVAAARARPPDLILADVMMPGTDGFALVTALRDSPETRAVPVILLSARAGEEATVEGLAAGADDYLIKPFSARELLARVQTHIELGRARREAAARAAQMDAIFEAVADGVLVHDLAGNTMHANRAYRELLRRHLEMQGYQTEPDSLLAVPAERGRYIAVGDERGNAVPLEEWATERALRGETLTGANAVDEFTRGADGSVMQVNVSAAPVRNATGQIIGAVAVFRDVTARRQLERQVAEQASQLQATFEAMTDGVFVLDADGHVTRVNGAAHALFGRIPRDGLTETATERARALAIRDAEGQLLAEQLLPSQRVLRGEVLAGESALTLMIHTHDGRERTISLTGGPLRDASGRITGGVSVVRDVTELKQAQTALAEQERLFRTLVENSPDIITRFDRNLRHRYVSPASETVTGIPAQARLGKTYAEIGLPESVYGPWEASLRTVFATGQTQVFETDYQADGRPPRTSQVRYIPEFAADGSIESVLGITSDITALKRTEEALRQSEERFSKAFHASPVAMAIISRTSGRILDANEAEFALLGYSRDETLGHAVAELGIVDPGDMQAVSKAIRPSTRFRDAPVRVRTKSGEERFCLVSTEPIKLEHEDCSIAITLDVTERRRAEEALQAATAAAEAAQREEEQRRREAERREQIAESLRDVLTVLNSNRQGSTVLDYIVRQAGRLLNGDAAAIYTTDSDDGAARHALNGATTLAAAPEMRIGTAGAVSGALTLQAAVGLSSAHPSINAASPSSSSSSSSRPSANRARHDLAIGDAAIRRAMSARRPVVVLAAPVAGAVGTADTADMPGRDLAQAATASRVGPARAQFTGYGDSGEDVGGAGGGIQADAAEYLLLRDEPLPAPYQALLAIPIIAQGQVYGGLLLLFRLPHRFTADEVAVALAYGDQIALAIANARLQAHIARSAVETERNRLARELHDTVTQEIFTASVLAESIPQVWERHRAEAEATLRQLHQLTRGALAALRALLLELRPVVLEQKALPELLQQLGEAMATRSGVPITLTMPDDDPAVLPTEVKVAFYRIAQEALMNAAKYAHAERIEMRLRGFSGGSGIQLDVRDDGQGFTAGAVPAGHFGLGMMRERARAVGAKLRISSRPGQGTCITVKWANSGRTAPTQEEYPAIRVSERSRHT